MERSDICLEGRGLEKLHARRFLALTPGSRPRLYDVAPPRGLRNQYQRQRNWDDPFSGASPTFTGPGPWRSGIARR
jgi:hypothetical protein